MDVCGETLSTGEGHRGLRTGPPGDRAPTSGSLDGLPTVLHPGYRPKKGWKVNQRWASEGRFSELFVYIFLSRKQSLGSPRQNRVSQLLIHEHMALNPCI